MKQFLTNIIIFSIPFSYNFQIVNLKEGVKLVRKNGNSGQKCDIVIADLKPRDLLSFGGQFDNSVPGWKGWWQKADFLVFINRNY